MIFYFIIELGYFINIMSALYSLSYVGDNLMCPCCTLWQWRLLDSDKCCYFIYGTTPNYYNNSRIVGCIVELKIVTRFFCKMLRDLLLARRKPIAPVLQI